MNACNFIPSYVLKPVRFNVVTFPLHFKPQKCKWFISAKKRFSFYDVPSIPSQSFSCQKIKQNYLVRSFILHSRNKGKIGLQLKGKRKKWVILRPVISLKRDRQYLFILFLELSFFLT